MHEEMMAGDVVIDGHTGPNMLKEEATQATKVSGIRCQTISRLYRFIVVYISTFQIFFFRRICIALLPYLYISVPGSGPSGGRRC